MERMAIFVQGTGACVRKCVMEMRARRVVDLNGYNVGF